MWRVLVSSSLRSGGCKLGAAAKTWPAAVFAKQRCFHSSAGSEETAAARVKAEIEGNSGVLIFSKSFCPFCKRAKETFGPSGGNTSAVVHELDLSGDGIEIQQALAALTGQRTVPNIFIGPNHIGGASELAKAVQEGQVKKMLDDLGINNSF